MFFIISTEIKEAYNMRKRNNYGYSHEKYIDTVHDTKPIILLGDGLKERYVYENGVKTDKIKNMIAMSYYPELGTQKIFLPVAFEFPKGLKDMEEIELINPAAYTDTYGNVFVEADGLKGLGGEK